MNGIMTKWKILPALSEKNLPLNMKELRAFILQKVQASVVERQKNKFCYSSLALGKKKHL
jgi:hypothetical protein